MGVIVPVHGRAPWLHEALESVLREDPAEVVVVDDGSPRPPDVPREVRVVRRETRGGPALARDAGLAALGEVELLALCDADDCWLPGSLGARVEALSAHPGAALCFGSPEVVDEHGEPTGERWPQPARPGLLERPADALWLDNPVTTSSVVLRRAAVEEAGGFAGREPLPVASDWDLWLRLVAAGGAIVWEPRARVRYRRHGGGVSFDLEALARARLELHARHESLVSPELRARARAADQVALARGLVRRRRYAEARAALRHAGALGPRERALAALLRVPGARAALGRRSPYPRGATRS